MSMSMEAKEATEKTPGFNIPLSAKIVGGVVLGISATAFSLLQYNKVELKVAPMSTSSEKEPALDFEKQSEGKSLLGLRLRLALLEVKDAKGKIVHPQETVIFQIDRDSEGKGSIILGEGNSAKRRFFVDPESNEQMDYYLADAVKKEGGLELGCNKLDWCESATCVVPKQKLMELMRRLKHQKSELELHELWYDPRTAGRQKIDTGGLLLKTKFNIRMLPCDGTTK